MNADAIEIAVDASVVRGLHAPGLRAPSVRSLLAVARAGKVRLVAWSRIPDDVPDVSLADYPITLVSSNPTELGIDVTRADPAVIRETVLGDEHFESRFANLQMLAAARGAAPSQNWDHMHFHVVNGPLCQDDVRRS